MKLVASVCGITLLLAVAGCGDSVTVYEPGVYKGDTDPLLEKQADADHQEQLRERFDAVQSDR